MNNNREFEQLLVAFANKELTADERQRLFDLAEGDTAGTGRLAEFEDLHRLLGEESALATQVMAPPDPAEETDESYRRLCQAAARAEQQLRGRLQNPVQEFGRDTATPFRSSRSGGTRSSRRWIWISAASAAALLVAVLAYAWSNQAPPLIPGKPDDKQLGVQILMQATVSHESRTLSWHDVVGARTYDARILDRDGRDFLVRPESRQRSIEWQLTEQQYQTLKAHPVPLYLRVVARDGAGTALATTGDLQLRIQ